MNLNSIDKKLVGKATAVVGVVAAILHLSVLKAFLGGIWASSGMIFTGLSVFSFSIAPELGVDSGVLTGATLAIGCIYGLKALSRAYDKFTDRV